MASARRTDWREETDLLVIGGGAAGMTAALVGSLEGLATVLCEKTPMLGGTTATSGGTTWVPGTSQSVTAGVPDRTEDARRFLAAVVGPRAGEAARAAFLDSGPTVLDYLEAKTALKFAAARAHPDYIANQPGAAYGGRALAPLAFDARTLGADFDRVRPPRPEFMVLGGMMLNRTDIPDPLHPFASARAFLQVAEMLTRHGMDRLRYRRGTNLVMGNAMVGRLLVSLRRQQVPIRFETRLEALVREEGRVVGALVTSPTGKIAIRARKGVVLATGGICWNTGLRARLFPEAARARSLAPETNTGDGIAAALLIGAALDPSEVSPGLWMPCSVLKRRDGSESVWPHIILDRSKPGLIAVNSTGRRFVNEADSYHDFCMGMMRADKTAPSVPAHLICDQSFVRDYGIGLVRPGTKNLQRFLAAGHLIGADDLTALAGKIGCDASALEETVRNHNRYAETGVDEEFGRGSSDLNRINGDALNKPNPCMRPIGPGPYYTVKVWPADLAGSAGLKGDENGSVVDAAGAPIPGLYASGNDLASIFRGAYPGPGTTLGPAIVFAWRAAMHAGRCADEAPAAAALTEAVREQA